MYSSVKFCTPRSGYPKTSKFSHILSLVEQTLLPKLKLLVKYRWPQPVTGGKRDLAGVTGRDQEEEGDGGDKRSPLGMMD